MLTFLLELDISGVAHGEYIKTVKNGNFCKELHNENDFVAVLANFCCYDYGGNASEAVQKISTRTGELFITCLLEIQARFLFFS